ncbi:MAG: outer membrane beta-barrel protein [Bacteroidota bacterium]|nr:outer membrane beta-barrel protein [Bacteroidota bacterium]
MRLISYIFLLFLLVFSHNLISQNDCKNNLKQAQDLYDGGEFDNCIHYSNSALANCLYSKKEKEDFYQLLIQSYLQTDNLVEADTYVKKLLNSNPNYEVPENNFTEDYSRLIKKYSVHPLFSIGLRNTVLSPSFKTTKVFSVLLDDVNYSAPYTTSKTLLMYYGWLEYEFTKNLSVNLEFTGLNIEYNRVLYKRDWDVTFKEKMTFFESPFYFKKYLFTTKTIFPYASVGMSYLKLLKSSADVQINYSNESYLTGEKSSFSRSMTDIDMLSLRKQNSFLWLIGGGVGFKFKNFGLFVDVRYYGGINNLTKTSNRFGNSSLINDYFYIDNSIKLNKFEGGISLSYTIKNLVKKSK